MFVADVVARFDCGLVAAICFLRVLKRKDAITYMLTRIGPKLKDSDIPAGFNVQGLKQQNWTSKKVKPIAAYAPPALGCKESFAALKMILRNIQSAVIHMIPGGSVSGKLLSRFSNLASQKWRAGMTWAEQADMVIAHLTLLEEDYEAIGEVEKSLMLSRAQVCQLGRIVEATKNDKEHADLIYRLCNYENSSVFFNESTLMAAVVPRVTKIASPKWDHFLANSPDCPCFECADVILTTTHFDACTLDDCEKCTVARIRELQTFFAERPSSAKAASNAATAETRLLKTRAEGRAAVSAADKFLLAAELALTTAESAKLRRQAALPLDELGRAKRQYLAVCSETFTAWKLVRAQRPALQDLVGPAELPVLFFVCDMVEYPSLAIGKHLHDLAMLYQFFEGFGKVEMRLGKAEGLRHIVPVKLDGAAPKLFPRGYVTKSFPTFEDAKLCPPLRQSCLSCGSERDDLSVCGKCEGAAFCDVACQRKAWNAGHKAVCRGQKA
jgi:hypothetical protein